MTTDAIFSILRRDGSGYSTRGPVAPALTLDKAREQLAALARQYPQQQFVILGEVGTAKRSDRVTVKVEAPSIAPAKPPAQKSTNVVPLGAKKAGN